VATIEWTLPVAPAPASTTIKIIISICSAGYLGIGRRPAVEGILHYSRERWRSVRSRASGVVPRAAPVRGIVVVCGDNNSPSQLVLGRCGLYFGGIGRDEEGFSAASVAGRKAPSSAMSRAQLRVTSASTAALLNYAFPVLPSSWMTSLYGSLNKDAPECDRRFLANDGKVLPYLNSLKYCAAQGGNPGVYDDLMIVLRPRQEHEETIRRIYCNSDNDDDDHGCNYKDDLPAVGIFQGDLDVNVPSSHARYMHESIFGQRSKLFTYDDLGHLSMIGGKSDDYAAFAVRGQ